MSKSAADFYKKVKRSGKEMISIKETTITTFLLCSLPLILSPLVFGINIAGLIFGYAVTLALLYGRLCLQGFAEHLEVSFFPQLIKALLLAVCFYFQVIRSVSLFGTEYTWILIYVFAGAVVTLLSRIYEGKEAKQGSRYFKDGIENIEKLNRTIRETERLYSALGESSENELRDFIRENALTVSLSPRTPWFGFSRSIDEKGNILSPEENHAKTDFKKPFSESPELITSSVSVKYDIRSQEFGWSNISASDVKALLSRGKISPFFNLELPEFLPELKYKIFKHSFDVTKHTFLDYDIEKNIKADSRAQKEFDSDTALREDIVLGVGKLDKMRYSNNYTTRAAVEHYDKKKARVREELGSDYKTYHEFKSSENTEVLRGDEIGAVLIYTPDDELIGAYCSDTRESVEFTSKAVRDLIDFCPYDLLSSPMSKSQIAYAFREYLK